MTKCAPNLIEDVEVFHMRGEIPQRCDYATATHRLMLCDEELSEVHAAVAERDVANIIHEFTDLAYVALGSLVQLVGARATEDAWEAISSANLRKVAGEARRDPTSGKILKPDDWYPADMSKVLFPYTSDIRVTLPGTSRCTRSNTYWDSKLCAMHGFTIILAWIWHKSSGWSIVGDMNDLTKLQVAKLNELVALRQLEDARYLVQDASNA